ncbi:hypothetical protein [Thauera humireducens]|uniref:hypothetical protein n=1 Tax=Thauera humireducens TaxID=1134435 RepID=UPI00311DBA6E
MAESPDWLKSVWMMLLAPVSTLCPPVAEKTPGPLGARSPTCPLPDAALRRPRSLNPA